MALYISLNDSFKVKFLDKVFYKLKLIHWKVLWLPPIEQVFLENSLHEHLINARKYLTLLFCLNKLEQKVVSD